MGVARLVSILSTISILLVIIAATAGAQPIPCECCEFEECIGRSPRNSIADPTAQYTYRLILRDNFCDPVVGYPAAQVELEIWPPCQNPVTLNPSGPSDEQGLMIFDAARLEQGGGACHGFDAAQIYVNALLVWTLDDVHSPDVDGDGEIALSDLAAWQQSFVNQSPTHVGNMDCDADEMIALSDLSFWQKHFVAR